ncbi:MAG: type II secretion system protein [Candidatus Staskawiczbacteria bacterium]|nr:type II secretion system protein [Candidatus Staskawiczbacteria bacterium]
MNKIKNRLSGGFTIIELVVVVAIIAILAGIVTANVVFYIGKAKESRANADAKNIEKALLAFSAQYGDYPNDQAICDGNPGEPDYICGPEDFYGSNGGEGSDNPSLNNNTHYLSEFYKSDYNADYFVQGGYYEVVLSDTPSSDTGIGDGKIGCGYVVLTDKDLNVYGIKCIICQDCTCSDDQNSDADCINNPFQTQKIF